MNRVSEPLVRSKMAITLEVKLSLSDFSRLIERQKEGHQETNITLILRRLVDLFLIDNIFDTLFLTDFFSNFQSEVDCLSVNHLIGRTLK